MKGIKVFLLVFLCLFSGVTYADGVLSSSYDTIESCNIDKEKFNTQFPDYSRTDCFENNGTFYYKICQTGDCTNDSMQLSGNGMITTSNTIKVNSYGETISTGVKQKLDSIINILKKSKDSLSIEDYKSNLNKFIQKLNLLELKYKNNSVVTNLIKYLRFEVEILLAEVNNTLSENELGNFMCELMGNCEKKIISVNVKSGLLACGDPTKNNYTTYSPVGGKVGIDTSYCNEKGGKIWVMCDGVKNNIKAVDTLKETDTFFCESKSTSTGSTNTMSGGIISSSVSSQNLGVSYPYYICSTEFKIVSCNSYFNFYPNLLSDYINPSNSGCSNEAMSQNGWKARYFDFPIANSNISLKGYGCAVVKKVNFCRKDSREKVSVETIKKETGIDNWADDSWSPLVVSDFNSRFTPTQNLSCTDKSLDTQYFEQSIGEKGPIISPEFSNTRLSDDKGQTHSWITKNATRLEWSCTSSNGETIKGENEKLNHDSYFLTWNELHENGWPKGIYSCIWSVSGNGITNKIGETFEIK